MEKVVFKVRENREGMTRKGKLSMLYILLAELESSRQAADESEALCMAHAAGAVGVRPHRVCLKVIKASLTFRDATVGIILADPLFTGIAELIARLDHMWEQSHESAKKFADLSYSSTVLYDKIGFSMAEWSSELQGYRRDLLAAFKAAEAGLYVEYCAADAMAAVSVQQNIDIVDDIPSLIIGTMSVQLPADDVSDDVSDITPDLQTDDSSNDTVVEVADDGVVYERPVVCDE